MRSWWWVKEKKKHMDLLITVAMILQFQMKGCVGCVETERMGLLQLKSYSSSLPGFGEGEGSNLNSWSDDDGPNSDCCNWEGVKCSDATGGHIVDLSLDSIFDYLELDQTDRGLNISLLHSFPQLKTLVLNNNCFSHLFDPIHGYKSFERLENLESLDLSSNRFNSSVLPFLSAAKSLRILNLGSNRLEGVFPPNGYKSFQTLENLESLDLSRNNFNISVLSFLSAAKSLRILRLARNSLEGVFPPNGYKSFQRLENLEDLDLSGNRFNNSVLPFLSAARSLWFLNLGGNRLEGVFPPNPNGLNNFRELEELYLSDNAIKDFEAGEGLRKTKLKTLDLRYNRLSETARLKGLEHLVELEFLSLSSNQLNNTRSIQVLKDMPKLQELDLSYNEFTDLDSLGSVLPSSLQVLDLINNNLSCSHEGYSKFCGLINLRELDLRSNALTSMPSCLGNLSRLRTLELSNNQLNNNLSAFVSGLPPNLEYLSLLDNNFNGSFLFNSLVNQTKLKELRLSSKVGTIQARAESPWVSLFQLEMLQLHNFTLGNTIPGFLVHQHNLSYVDLSHNKMKGPFPTWLVRNNTRLKVIFLDNNLLTEFQLPLLVHDLEILDISSNMIYDSMQEDMGIFFPKLVYMNFSSNQLHGTIPSSLGEMKGLEWLDMSSNDLSGQLPTTFWSGCYSLRIINLSNNQIQGKIFPEHANLTSLNLLHLDGNNFSGSIGEGVLNSKELVGLDLSDNKFSGMVPLWMGKMIGLQYLIMRGNQLKGPFPHHLLQSSRLGILDMSHNSFSGSIPRDVNFSSLLHLRLQNNAFWGLIPDTLFKAETLQVLDLRNNNFSGMIPNTFGERSSLRVLLLGNNNLQSHVPEQICQLSEIRLLDLSHNKFNGVISSCLGNMSFGADMSGSWETNYFSPGIPFSLYSSYTTSFSLINDLDRRFASIVTVVDFLTKSRYEAYQGNILRYMYGLDLSSNQISGEIPIEIGNLDNVRCLNFSSNRLTGSIPYSISKLKDLESLDLSNNELSGNIPSVLANLDSLGYFNVSFNNFSGEIPFKSHLVTFGEKSYIGNAHLCGRPTNISCNPTRVPKEESAPTHAQEEEEDEVIDMEWFYWTSGSVYISTCLALFAFLCIDTRWSQEWLYRVDLFIYHLQRFKRSAFRN